MIKRVEGAAAVAFSPLGISDGFLDAVRRGLEGTVNGVGGSAVSVQLSEGLASVAGLAGASQISRMPNEGDQETLAWDARAHGLFVAYVPADVPRFAVAAVVEHGGTGARSAAPLVRDVIAAIFEKHQASPVPVGPPASGDAGEPVGRPVPGQEG